MSGGDLIGGHIHSMTWEKHGTGDRCILCVNCRWNGLFTYKYIIHIYI